MGKDPDPMHAQGGPYQRLLPGQTLGGAKAVGGMTTAPGNATVNGRMRYVGSPDYGATGGRGSTNSAHIGGKPRTYGNADEYYADHSNLRDLHAENSVDPVTGMKVKPSSFDMESKRAELARNGEWDALARLNEHSQAMASGDPGAIRAARENITSFRAQRQAKQEYGQGPAADMGAFGKDNRAPGDFSPVRPSGLQSGNPFARDPRAPGDFGTPVAGGVGAMQEGNPYARDTRAPGDFSNEGLAPEAGAQASHPWLRNPYTLGSSGRGVGPLAPEAQQAPITSAFSPADRNRNDYTEQQIAQLEEEGRAPASRALERFGNAAKGRVLGSATTIARNLTSLPRAIARLVPQNPQLGTWFRGDPEKQAEAQRLRAQLR